MIDESVIGTFIFIIGFAFVMTQNILQKLYFVSGLVRNWSEYHSVESGLYDEILNDIKSGVNLFYAIPGLRDSYPVKIKWLSGQFQTRLESVVDDVTLVDKDGYLPKGPLFVSKQIVVPRTEFESHEDKDISYGEIQLSNGDFLDIRCIKGALTTDKTNSAQFYKSGLIYEALPKNAILLSDDQISPF